MIPTSSHYLLRSKCILGFTPGDIDGQWDSISKHAIDLIIKLADTTSRLDHLRDNEIICLHEELLHAQQWCTDRFKAMEPVASRGRSNEGWCRLLALLVETQILSEDLANKLALTDAQRHELEAYSWRHSAALRHHLDDPIILRGEHQIFVAYRTECLGKQLLFKGYALSSTLLQDSASGNISYLHDCTICRSDSAMERNEICGVAPRRVTDTMLDLASGSEMHVDIWQKTLFFNFGQLRRVHYSWMPALPNIMTALLEVIEMLESAVSAGKLWQASLDSIVCYNRYKRLGFGLGPGREQLTDQNLWPFYAAQVSSWLETVLLDFAQRATTASEHAQLLSHVESVRRHANAISFQPLIDCAQQIASDHEPVYSSLSQQRRWFTPYRLDDDAPRAPKMPYGKETLKYKLEIDNLQFMTASRHDNLLLQAVQLPDLHQVVCKREHSE